MSGYAVPFLYGMAPVSFVPRFHLSMSHWAFVLTGLHLGLHIPAMFAGRTLSRRTESVLFILFGVLAAGGLYLFLSGEMTDYLFFRVVFASYNYGETAAVVFLENLLILLLFVFIGACCSVLCRKCMREKKEI